MRLRLYISLLSLFCVGLVAAPHVRAESREDRERQVKAAFLYNFISFVDWPKGEITDSNQPITIGVIGSRDFLKALEPMQEKKAKGRNISIKHFPDYDKPDEFQQTNDARRAKATKALKSCHVLLLCTCDFGPIESTPWVIKALKDSPVLTVGETSGFLESGGIINFLMEDEKVRFEINNAAAKQAKLKIRSKLLRLAERVIGEEESEVTDN